MADPEWLPFLTVLLFPALAAIALGESRLAGFLAGAAVYLATLKWVGWMVLPPPPPFPLNLPRFPAEVLAGLAVASAWFYVRALVERLVPGTFGLAELRALTVALAALHLAALVRSWFVAGVGTASSLRSHALGWVAAYGPFAGLLALALARVGTGPGVHSGDALVHAFSTDAFLHHGTSFSLPRTGLAFGYPAGFGAISAVAVALAPLTPAQAVNLLPVLLGLAALFMVAAAVARLAGRFWPALSLAVAGFTLLFPLYALFPDFGHNGEPRQASLGLLTALALLPVAVGPDRRAGGVGLATVLGLLAALACALNPSCAPFAALAWGMGLAVSVGQWWYSAGRGAAALVGVGQVVLTLAAFTLVLAWDPYYGSLLREAWRDDRAPRPMSPPEATPPAPVSREGAAEPRTLWKEALHAALAQPPWAFSPSVSANVDPDSPRGRLARWPERWPHKAVPPLAATLALCVTWLAYRHGRPWPDGVGRLLALVAGAVAAWWLVRATVHALERLVDPGASWQRRLLSTYLGFLLIRCEVVIVAAALLAAGAAGWVLVTSRAKGQAHLTSRVRWSLGIVAAAGMLGLAGLGYVFRSGAVVVPPNDLMAVSEDDLRLVAWCDEHIPADQGDIGMAADAGTPEGEKYLYGLGGAQAFQLYGRSGNYRFVHAFLEKEGHDDYLNHVRDRLDTGWCLRQNIRYFYLGPHRLKANKGLLQAVGDGDLLELRRFGESAVYVLRPPE